MERLLQIPIDEYHARPELSHSQLCRMRVPAVFRYEHALVDCNLPTDAMKLGTLIHTLLMESDKFEATYAVTEKFDMRYSAEKERYKAFMEANAGKQLIDPGTLSQAMGMAKSVTEHPEAALLLEDAIFERSIIWDDKLTGVPLRCRPDGLRPDVAVKLDIKTSADVSPEAFSRSMYKFNYATQAAFYRDGCADAGINIEHDVLIAVCSAPPYLCAVYEIGERSIERGRLRYRRWLDKYVECMASGIWPAYPGIKTIELSEWANMEDE